MGAEYTAKVFKSGNSLALRLPAALGVAEGTEMRLREEAGRFVFEPATAPKRKIDISKFVGSAPWLKPLPPREDFDDPPRAWDHPDWPAWPGRDV